MSRETDTKPPTIKQDPDGEDVTPTVDVKPKPLIKMAARGRAHKNLVALDQCTWSYHGWETDKETAEDSHFNSPSKFPDALTKMQRRQDTHEGDRSHANLVALDAITWTYKGWKDDKKVAECHHCSGRDGTLQASIGAMKRKQALHDGDRSDAQLKRLDALACSYDGWKGDRQEAERLHVGSSFSFQFDGQLAKMVNKQAAHERAAAEKASHSTASLQKQDDDTASDKTLAPGGNIFDSNSGFGDSDGDDDTSDDETSDEDTSDDDTSDDDTSDDDTSTSKAGARKIKSEPKVEDLATGIKLPVAFSTATWSYPDWLHDFSEATNAFKSDPSSFDSKFKEMKAKQKAHPVVFDHVHFTYPGWETDKLEAVQIYTSDRRAFERKLKAMKRMQKAHERASDPQLAALDALVLTFPGWKDAKDQAENSFVEWKHTFEKEMNKLQKLQNLHDKSDPKLEDLFATNWTYPGWKKDKSKAKEYYIDSYDCVNRRDRFVRFDDKLQGMKHKQEAHEGADATCPIMLLDSKDDDPSDGAAAAPVVLEGDGTAGCPIVLGDESSAGKRRRRRRRRSPTKKRRKGQQTTSRNPTVDVSSKCVVCLKSEISHEFDCGHRCVCKQCSSWALNQGNCPICRKKVTSASEAAPKDTRGAMVDLTNKPN